MIDNIVPLSSAQILADELRVKFGISQTELSAVHVDSIYRRMPKINEAADFLKLSDVLAVSDKPITESTKEVFGVIVETRCHPALETVVLNIANTCSIPIQLFHGTTNLEYILSSEIAQLVESGRVILSRLNADVLDAQSYNALFLCPDFFNMMIGRRKFLVFQTDSLCCEESSFSIHDFLSYDYIGGCWNPNRPVGLVINGGNGGFSLRDWDVSINCLSRFPATLWGGGEDGYYAFHMDLIGAKVASMSESAEFATQDHFTCRSFGAHAIYNLSECDRRNFFSYCTLAKQVFPHVYSQLT